MTEPAARRFQAGILLEPLVRHRVQFVIVGGFAGVLHGATRPTSDLDICPAWHTKNLERLAAALNDLDAALRLRPELQPTIVRPNPELLRVMTATLWTCRTGNIDVLLGISDGPGSLACFPELERRATEFQLRDGALLVAALEDLVRSKEIADRAKDRQALPELRRLLEASRRSAAAQGQLIDQFARRSRVVQPESLRPTADDRGRSRPSAPGL